MLKNSPRLQPRLRQGRPVLGVLAGWQFYNIATNLSYLLPIFKGINRAAQDAGCSLLLGCGMGAAGGAGDVLRPAWPDPSPDVDYVPIGPWNTDGIILFTPLHSPARSRFAQNLIASGHPVFFIGSGEMGPTLAADNEGGIYEAIHHLAEHGHRRIAFIAGSPDDMAGDTGERLKAYQAAMEANDLKVDHRLVAYGAHVFDGGYAAIQQMLASGAGFSAVLASNDEMALGAIQALKEAGRQVPGDTAVIGFDNRLEGAAHTPSLSSIHIPLFNMGYQAVEYLLQHIGGQMELPEIVRLPTRLVARESCGCGSRSIPSLSGDSLAPPPGADPAGRRVQWAGWIAETVMNQARNLDEKECRSFSQRLVDSFVLPREQNGGHAFLEQLEQVLNRTVKVGDDAHIWQAAITLLEKQCSGGDASWMHPLLDQARSAISARMQQQHRRFVANQSWVTSRLSLLTAALLNALDETQIYAILAQHLPVLDIHQALIVFFDGEGEDRLAWSTMRSAFAPHEPPIRFPGSQFPPPGLYPADNPYHLALIPLVNQAGQLGYVVFDTAHIELYGAIVQQLGGALSAARLYRQATEGQRMAEEANRMKSRFLSVISHELRTPVNLIAGLSEIVIKASDEGETPLPEATQKDIERIHTYSQHLGGLIGDVLDLSTSDAGALRLNNDFVDLGQALRIVAESGRQLAADKGLAWEAVLPEASPWVWGDRTRLRQVALNLINNAVKFTEQGSVSLYVETGPGSVEVRVSDTGLGISQDEQQAIFDEFHQSEHSVALGYGGLGLGLAISKRLVELHGGAIGVRSSGKAGAGSTFYFTLPTVQPPAEKTGRKENLPERQQTLLVLTSEPEANRAEAGGRLSERLGQQGIRVQVASLLPPERWQSLLIELAPDAVLLDAGAPAELQWSTIRTIKGSQSGREIPVMFYKSSQDGGALLDLDYLTKPIELAELTQALDQQWLLAEVDHSRRTILVVDDEPNTLEMNARIVQAHSASNQVLKAHNGREAIELLGQQPVDLVLLDLQMPELDGFGVLEKMHESEGLRQVPVIVITGKVLSEADMARLNRGVTAVLEKGLFSLDETVDRIRLALERKRRLSGEAQRLVRKAMAYIHEHYADPISRREIAQHVSISDDHLTFCFRQELGTTPIEYLQRYRVNQGKYWLKNSEKTISEIALDVGFSDSGYFSRIFRRITGMSPETFRRA